MKIQSIQQAVNLAQTLQHVFVATSDASGLPHLAAASRIEVVEDAKVAISEWFCPGTLENLEQNHRIALVIWDAAVDKGYQLLGEVEDMNREAMMNGYAPELASRQPLPQVEWRLTVRVDKVLAFSHAPHSDVEE
jgi:hypothetical protein